MGTNLMYTQLSDPQTFGIGLLIARLALGLLVAAHGAQKLFGWFGGYGLKVTGEFFVGLGFPPGPLFAGAAGLAELVGGLLVALGLLGPVGPALVISVMIVAGITVHLSNGLFAQNNGVELPLLNAAVAFGLALAGYGPYSLDAYLGITPLWSPMLTYSVLAVGVLGGIGNLIIRHQRPSAQGARK
ncbi:MAG TPA: DoxX family protein [Gemmatimonadaceae bacterium]|nr:DoxX family protein [Gemmatimonadaceae bacterium]